MFISYITKKMVPCLKQKNVGLYPHFNNIKESQNGISSSVTTLERATINSW